MKGIISLRLYLWQNMLINLFPRDYSKIYKCTHILENVSVLRTSHFNNLDTLYNYQHYLSC